VVDENGDPSAGTQVRALRYIIRTGERTLQQAGVDSTDDRGMYRIYDLQPGEYIVNAVPRNLNLGDARVVIANQLQVLMQQAQARGGGAAGGGGLGALSAEFVGVANAQPAQDVVARVELLQQQLAAAEQEQAVAYAPVYYPGTTSAGAAGTVTLNAGEERSGVDFQLQLVPTSRVDGSVVGPDGAPQPNVQVGLVPAAQAGVPSVPGGLSITRVGPDGRFSFRAVTPGQYTVQARLAIRGNAGAPDVSGRGGRGGPLPAGRGGQVTEVLWASLDLSVNGQDTPNVALTLQPGMTVSGRVEIDDAMAGGNVDFSRVRLALTPRGSDGFEIGGAVPPATVDPSGRFTIVGVSPGRYTLTGGVAGGGQMQRGGNPGPLAAGGPANLTVKSAMANGRDLLDFPIEIGPNDDLSNVVVSFSSKVQELSGTIQNTAGQPVSDYTIIVFPSDSRYWQPMARRIAASRPGTDGRFVFRGLPPGEYRITAVTDAEPGEWYDPAFLNQVVPASIPISLREGETRVQDIRLAGN
jgi:uncharacterized protein (DUF2141 family)